MDNITLVLLFIISFITVANTLLLESCLEYGSCLSSITVSILPINYIMNIFLVVRLERSLRSSSLHILFLKLVITILTLLRHYINRLLHKILFLCFSINCGHSFCDHCIHEWKRKKNNCPVCRTTIKSINPVKVHRLFLD